jgi:hypothetical protein
MYSFVMAAGNVEKNEGINDKTVEGLLIANRP